MPEFMGFPPHVVLISQMEEMKAGFQKEMTKIWETVLV